MQKVKATFLLSGWAAAEDGGEARHVVRLVEGQQVRLLLAGHNTALLVLQWLPSRLGHERQRQ